MLSHPVLGPICWFVMAWGGLFITTMLAAVFIRHNRQRWYRLLFNTVGFACIALSLYNTIVVTVSSVQTTYCASRDTNFNRQLNFVFELQRQAGQGKAEAKQRLPKELVELETRRAPGTSDYVASSFLAICALILLTIFLPIPVVSLGFGLTALTCGGISPEGKLVSGSWHHETLRQVLSEGRDKKTANICRLSWSVGLSGWLQILGFLVASGCIILWFFIRPLYNFLVWADIYNPMMLAPFGGDGAKREDALLGTVRLLGVRLSPLVIGSGVVAIWWATQLFNGVLLLTLTGVLVGILLFDVVLALWCGQSVTEFHPFTRDSSPVTRATVRVIVKARVAGRHQCSNWRNFRQSVHRAICPSLSDE